MSTSGSASEVARTEDPDERTNAIRALEGEFGELFNRVRRVMADNAQRLSPGMLPASYKVFTTIVRRGSVTLSALAESLVADKGQISRTVRELEDLGLVERTPDPSDGRSSIISPTADGIARLDEARAPLENSFLGRLESWSLGDIRELTRLLHAVTVDPATDVAGA